MDKFFLKALRWMTVLLLVAAFGGCATRWTRRGPDLHPGDTSAWFGIGTDTEQNFYYLLGDRFEEPGRLPCRLAAQVRPGEVLLFLVVEARTGEEPTVEDSQGRSTSLEPSPDGQKGVARLLVSPAQLRQEISPEGLLFRIHGARPETSCRISREVAERFLQSVEAVFIKE